MGGASSSESHGTCAANQSVLPCIDDPSSSLSSIISINDHVETMLPDGSVQSGGSTLQQSPVQSGSANGTSCSSLDKARASQ